MITKLISLVAAVVFALALVLLTGSGAHVAASDTKPSSVDLPTPGPSATVDHINVGCELLPMTTTHAPLQQTALRLYAPGYIAYVQGYCYYECRVCTWDPGTQRLDCYDCRLVCPPL